MTQNADHIRDVSALAAKYMTPGGPDDFDMPIDTTTPKPNINNTNNDQDDDKKQSSSDMNLGPPPSLDRQVTAYFFNKYTPSQLKELVEKVFETHFDVEQNNDIDVTEFTNALKNLGLNMAKTRIEKLFRLISSNDGDASGQYIDKVNFSDFILEKYPNQPNLQQYQEELLRAISPKFSGDKQVKLDEMTSYNTDAAEMDAMQRHLKLMLQQEQNTLMQDSLFQEELLKKKTSNESGKKFCDEFNAENWDRYEVAYWVGNILDFKYCMKRFFDEKITGSMLLYKDIDEKTLIQTIGLKSIHLNNFQRRLENLRKIALKDLYEAERKKQQERLQKEEMKELERKEMEREQRRNSYSNRDSLSLDFKPMDNIHIASEMIHREDETKLMVQQIELQATKTESKLNSNIAELNKEITKLTKEKLDLMQKLTEIKMPYEQEISLLKMKLEQALSRSEGGDKEVQNLERERDLLRKKNDGLRQRNEELQQMIKERQDVAGDSKQDEKRNEVLEIEIEKLKSQLRTRDNQNMLLKSKLKKQESKLLQYKSISAEMVDDYDGDQISENAQDLLDDKEVKYRVEPPSPKKTSHVGSGNKEVRYQRRKPGQFLSANQHIPGASSSMSGQTRKSKKSSLDYADDYEENDDGGGMIIYDSDNTPQ